MKIDRFIAALTSSDRFIELQPDPEGSLCFASEVVKLEAKCAELETKGAELLEALEWLVTIQSIVSIPEAMHSRTYQKAVEQARAAIAKAKGEVMP